MIIVRWIFQCVLVVLLLVLSIAIMIPSLMVRLCHRLYPSNITSCMSSILYSYQENAFYWIITKALNITLSIHKTGADLSGGATRIVMVNHQSFFDTMLMIGMGGYLVEGEKLFVLKDSLKWLPFWGWYCWLSSYPFVKRLTLKQLRANPKLKEQAINDFKAAIRKNKDVVKTWIIYPEGTRNDGKKKSHYRYLLKPQIKGVQLIESEAGQPIQLVNVSLCFPKPFLSFWQIITSVKSISIHINVHEVKEAVCPAFIDDQWAIEDKRLQAHYENS